VVRAYEMGEAIRAGQPTVTEQSKKILFGQDAATQRERSGTA
jgi:hypothetical protein